MTKSQLTILYVISIVGVVACFFIEPVPQNATYHLFADRRPCCSIPNFWNVVSNMPFVVVGFAGLITLNSIDKNPLNPNYIWFFIGILLTGFGSGYYHLYPDNETLVWDRLPMTITFMSFFSVIIGEFIDADSGKKLLYPFLTIGVASIVYWILTDDLRMYALVQFLPIVLILIILFLSKKELKFKRYFWLIVVFYTIAKFLESYDELIYNVFQKTMSGHTLKHLAAAVAPYLFYKFVVKKFKTP